MFILRIVLVLSTIARPACGQTISFLRELSRTQYQQAGSVAVDATGVYTVAWEGADRSSPVGLLRKHDGRGNDSGKSRQQVRLKHDKIGNTTTRSAIGIPANIVLPHYQRRHPSDHTPAASTPRL